MPPDWQPAQLESSEIETSRAVEGVSLSGGVFWHVMPVSFDQAAESVIDFRNSSVIGRFNHWVFDADGNLVETLEGGVQSQAPNPYFLRHGRTISLEAGNYQIITKLDSPFFLAQPEPTLFDPDRYRQSIKVGNTVTLVGLGIFFALGIYYIVLGTARGRAGDLYYAAFIVGNLLYNGAALLVFSDLFGIHQFYLISVPILFSNTAYIAFVMVLLNINKQTSRGLYYAGSAIIALLVSFWVIAFFKPNLSLELDRIGVGFFALYGFGAGIVRIFQGNRTARYYLVANAAFIIPALISIRASTLPVGETLFIEHIGLFAVAIEVVLLSLVISYQVGMVYREKEAGLLATQEALLAANHALETKERFLANVSHELRTPLNAIQGSVELISQHKLPVRVNRHIEAIHSSSNFLLYLINDILDLAKMNADQLTLVNEAFELDEAVDDLCSIYKNSFNRDQVRFLVDMDPELPTNVEGDENRIKQILANLLSNAFKFTERGEVILSIQRGEGNRLSFRVTDTGIGIDTDKLHTVFSAFTQADASISRKYGGTGLGLQIASKLVRLMGDNLSVESRPGHGSAFYFSIPLPGIQQKPIVPAHSTGLIYEDSQLQQIARQDLQRLNVTPSVEYTMQEALAVSSLPKDVLHWLVIADQFDESLSARFGRDKKVHWLINRNISPELGLDRTPDIELIPCAHATLFKMLNPAVKEKDQQQHNAILQNLRVVSVDDNAVNLKVLMSMLNRLGVSSVGFDRAEEALKYINHQMPDLVLMDVQMPLLDGLEATRLLRHQTYDNPIIAFTANASDHDLKDCIQAGMNDVLVKPIKLDDLKTMLLKWAEKVTPVK